VRSVALLFYERRLKVLVIRVFRKQAGLTITELAKASGLNYTTICYAEMGGHKLNLQTVERIAKVFGISASELLFADEVLTRKQAAEQMVEEHALTG
jgi:transcriptional regulator with XRE-family HTH domain